LEEPAASIFRVEEQAEHGRNGTVIEKREDWEPEQINRNIENCLKTTGPSKPNFPRAG
jgi:hypothetical protein